jgi:hypothetical protein
MLAPGETFFLRRSHDFTILQQRRGRIMVKRRNSKNVGAHSFPGANISG